MVSEDELLNVMKTTLQQDGEYGRLRADLQTRLMRALGLDKQLADPSKPQTPKNMALVNELVREYLHWCGFKFSEMIFVSEASSPSSPMSREELCQQLNVKDSEETRQLNEQPTLYDLRWDLETGILPIFLSKANTTYTPVYTYE